MKDLVSVVIRTLNEEKYLAELLSAIKTQDRSIFDIEVIIIDSGSTDATLEIARSYDASVTFINKKDFSFGRSLNQGCEYSNGDFLVFISGHCVPRDESWINALVLPLQKDCSYSYGRQLPRDTTKFSEGLLFDKYFPNQSRIPQVGYFVNNANAAIRRDVWAQYMFDEDVTGCEDMYLAKKITDDGGRIGYSAEAAVYHIHDESWRQIRHRYEREAIVVTQLLSGARLTKVEFLQYLFVGIAKDSKAALRQGRFMREVYGIFRFRLAQFTGAYFGSRMDELRSQDAKMKYFYPRKTNMDIQ